MLIFFSFIVSALKLSVEKCGIITIHYWVNSIIVKFYYSKFSNPKSKKIRRRKQVYFELIFQLKKHFADYYFITELLNLNETSTLDWFYIEEKENHHEKCISFYHELK